MYPGWAEVQQLRAQIKLGVNPWAEQDRAMDYQDQVAIGANLNEAIARALQGRMPIRALQSWMPIPNPQVISDVAQAVLVQLDRAGYQIVRK